MPMPSGTTKRLPTERKMGRFMATELTSPDAQTITATLLKFAEAWNAHDASRLTPLFAENADFVNVMGMWQKSRNELVNAHAETFATIFRGSRMTFLETTVKFHKPDVAVAHTTWHLEGQRGPTGEKLPDRKGILTATVLKQDDGWEIVAIHNTDIVVPSEYKPYVGEIR